MKKIKRKKTIVRRVGRSAKTGRFVKKSYAKKHPSTTVVESVRIGKWDDTIDVGPKFRKVARSAKTGRFVKKSFADKHPSTTIVEKIKFDKSLDTGTIDAGPKRRKK